MYAENRARGGFPQTARPACNGNRILPQDLRELVVTSLVAIALVLAFFAGIWTSTAFYQAGYVDGYEDAKAALIDG